MAYIQREALMDFSTKTEFCFGIRCSECRNIRKSTPVRFSRAGVEPESEEKRIIFDALYQQEKELAMKAALAQMNEVFSFCPICHRLICDRCFLICEDLDMCVSCAKELKQRGTPVNEDDQTQPAEKEGESCDE